MSLRDRIRKAQGDCIAMAGNGDRCTRREPHGPEDMHQRGAHTWGAQDPTKPSWLRNLQARDNTSGVLGR